MKGLPFPALMVQGCTSDAGKSTVVAALCRLLARDGVAVAPFKPQNMGLNSAVTVDGGEIGRAQALQAIAAGIDPVSDLNPVLLKPQANGMQVIVGGQVVSGMDAHGFHAYKPQALEAACAAFARLQGRYRTVLVEGAGSPAEVNLRAGDLANMGFAEAVDCPVVLVVDIDKGGAFAHLVGTLACLSATERARVVGFVINRFRGLPELLADGVDWLERETGKPVLAVLPHLDGLVLDAEDAIDARQSRGAFRVVVPALPCLSNHTDFDALRAHPGVDLTYARIGQPLPPADLIVLAGSKDTRAGLAALKANGWDADIRRHLRYGGKLIGVCGGFQMLGQRVADPDGVEGPAGTDAGLALLAIDTRLGGSKRLARVTGHCAFADARVEGYEMHMGVSRGPALAQPAFLLDDGPEGAIGADGQILGSYVHGLFDYPAAQAALLGWAGMADAQGVNLSALREASLERLADACLPLYRALQALGKD